MSREFEVMDAVIEAMAECYDPTRIHQSADIGKEWAGHMVHGDKESIEAVRRAVSACAGVSTKALHELAERFNNTIPTPMNRRGESTMRIEHFVDLMHEAKQELAALDALSELGNLPPPPGGKERG